MRRVFAVGMVLALGVVLMAGPAVAQMGFGIKGGLNFAEFSDIETIDTLDELETESKSDFVGGVYVKFPIGVFRLQIEGLYSRKGGEGQYNNDGLGTAPWETQLTYVEIPVLLKYEFPTSVLKPFLYGGGSIAFLMEAEKRNQTFDTDWVDIKDDLKSTDYGLVVGAGIEIIGITLEGRYTHGMADTIDQKSGDLQVDEAKNKTWSVMAGIDFF